MSIPLTAKAWVLPKNSKTGEDGLRFVEFPVETPGRGEILVKMRAASLNYRDLLVSFNQYPHAEFDEGLIICSDAAGDVVEVGEGVTEYKIGDRIHTLFHRDWLTGPPTAANVDSPVGGNVQGVAIEYRTFRASAVLPIPEHLYYEEASTIPCAGVTAYAALFENSEPVGPDSEVLTMGTGGVSIWAVQLAKVAGARVIATSSSDNKIETLKQLGADETINYLKTPDWKSEVLRLTKGRGVDHVLEIGGPGTLIPAIESARIGGHVHIVGYSMAKGEAGNISLASIINQVHLHGHKVGSRDMAARLDKVITQHRIKPVIDQVFKFEDLRAAWQHQQAQKHVGKVVLTFD